MEMDDFFRLSLSTTIFFMQCGFAFMEAGAVRSKNTVNILLKNWLDLCIGAIVFWAVGFALMNGYIWSTLAHQGNQGVAICPVPCSYVQE